MITIQEYEHRHNIKFPDYLIKVVKREGNFIYFETEFGLCKKYYNTFGKNNYSISSAINKVDFLKNILLKLYGGTQYTFLFDDYKNNKQMIKMKCNIHGIKNKHVAHILTGKAGCKICANILNNPNKPLDNNIFIQKAKLIHDDRYDYSLIEYKNNHTLIKIICKEHGIFEQTPSNHLKPSNCPICNNKIKHLNGCGWSLKKWLCNGNKSKNFDSFKVYILECWNENEHFYKIGKTFTTVKKRFYHKSALPYNYKILKEITGSAEFTFKLETKLKKENKEHEYIPLLNFGGKQECFLQLKQNFWEEL